MASLRTTITAAAMLAFLAGTATAAKPATCLVEQNFYYPKDGMAEQALAVRIRAEEIREKLGLTAGRVLVVEKATSRQPSSGKVAPLDMSYITSLTEYASEQASLAARQQLQQSEEYLAIRKEMNQLLRHFETATWRPVRGGCTADAK